MFKTSEKNDVVMFLNWTDSVKALTSGYGPLSTIGGMTTRSKTGILYIFVYFSSFILCFQYVITVCSASVVLN